MQQMNLFYHDVTKDQQELKPSELEEGQVRQHLTHRWIRPGLDLCLPVFPRRFVWCTGLCGSRGAEPWWSRSLWTLCAAQLAACWWITENVWLFLLTSKKLASSSGAILALPPTQLLAATYCSRLGVTRASTPFPKLVETPGSAGQVMCEVRQPRWRLLRCRGALTFSAETSVTMLLSSHTLIK